MYLRQTPTNQTKELTDWLADCRYWIIDLLSQLLWLNQYIRPTVWYIESLNNNINTNLIWTKPKTHQEQWPDQMIFLSLVASPIQERNLNKPNKLNWTDAPPSWLMVMMRMTDWTDTKWPIKTSWDTFTRNLNGFMESSDWYMNNLKMLWITTKPNWLNLNWMDRPKMARLFW